MTQRPATRNWIGSAFLSALVAAAIVLAAFGSGIPGTGRALQVTARLSFILFWAAYAGGALARLFGSTFRPMARRGRQFGLAFASAHLIHIALVIWLYWISPQPPLGPALFWFFAIGLMWTYLLALFSINRLSQALPPWLSRILRLAGMEYISFAFLYDFVNQPFHIHALYLLGYLPFATLSVMGTALRLAAWMAAQPAVIRQPEITPLP